MEKRALYREKGVIIWRKGHLMKSKASYKTEGHHMSRRATLWRNGHYMKGRA